jgi:hypothetical protein
LLDDIGPGPRPIEKHVRDDLLARARFGELGRPREIGDPVGKYQFCHDVKADRAVFLVEFVARIRKLCL